MGPNNRKRTATGPQPRDSKKAKKLENHRLNDHDGAFPGDRFQDLETSGPEISSYPSRVRDPWIQDLKEQHRRDTWAEDFQAKVLNEKGSLLGSLNGKINALEHADQRFKNSFHETMRAVICPTGTNADMRTPPVTSGSLGLQPLYLKSARLLETSRELLKTYHGLANRGPTIAKIAEAREELTKEAQLVREMIAAGKTSVHWDMERLLHDTKGESKRAPPTKDAALNGMVETMLAQGHEEGEDTRAWGQTAADIKKAYNKVYKIAKSFE